MRRLFAAITIGLLVVLAYQTFNQPSFPSGQQIAKELHRQGKVVVGLRDLQRLEREAR